MGSRPDGRKQIALKEALVRVQTGVWGMWSEDWKERVDPWIVAPV